MSTSLRSSPPPSSRRAGGATRVVSAPSRRLLVLVLVALLLTSALAGLGAGLASRNDAPSARGLPSSVVTSTRVPDPPAPDEPLARGPDGRLVVDATRLLPPEAVSATVVAAAVPGAWRLVSSLPAASLSLAATGYSPGADVAAVGYAALPSSASGRYTPTGRPETVAPLLDVVYVVARSAEAARTEQGRLLEGASSSTFASAVRGRVLVLTPVWADPDQVAGAGDAPDAFRTATDAAAPAGSGLWWTDAPGYLRSVAGLLDVPRRDTFAAGTEVALAARPGVTWTGTPAASALEWEGRTSSAETYPLDPERALREASERTTDLGVLQALAAVALAPRSGAPQGEQTATVQLPSVYGGVASGVGAPGVRELRVTFGPLDAWRLTVVPGEQPTEVTQPPDVPYPSDVPSRA